MPPARDSAITASRPWPKEFPIKIVLGAGLQLFGVRNLARLGRGGTQPALRLSSWLRGPQARGQLSESVGMPGALGVVLRGLGRPIT